MSRLRTYCEVSWIKDGELKEGEPEMERDFYYLLHWGLKYEIVNNVAVGYTVGICQNIKSGAVECFNPESIRIIGNEIKE